MVLHRVCYYCHDSLYTCKMPWVPWWSHWCFIFFSFFVCWSGRGSKGMGVRVLKYERLVWRLRMYKAMLCYSRMLLHKSVFSEVPDTHCLPRLSCDCSSSAGEPAVSEVMMINVHTALTMCAPGSSTPPLYLYSLILTIMTKGRFYCFLQSSLCGWGNWSTKRLSNLSQV